MRIALLEDDLDQAALIKAWIVEAGHVCAVFNQGKLLIRELNRDTFDLVILDWMLPDIDGIDVLKWARKSLNWPVPVLFVTAKDNETDVIMALDAGADDYMAKPIKKGELLARLNALLRRTHPVSLYTDELKYGAYTIIPSNNSICIKDTPIEVTQKEFELMLFLFKNAGRIISRGYILERVWGAASNLNTRTVDTHVSRIRAKLFLRGEYGWFLRSIYQHGYRLERSEDPSL